MEQTDNIEALMERIKEQETMYEFDRIDEELALQMGFYVVRRAREMGKPVATRITLNRRTLFSLSMAGTKPESDNWLRRKENLAYATNQSSYFWECWCEQGSIPSNGEACRMRIMRQQAVAFPCALRARAWWAPWPFREWQAMKIMHWLSRRLKRPCVANWALMSLV